MQERLELAMLCVCGCRTEKRVLSDRAIDLPSSRKPRAAGRKFGLWVLPSRVDRPGRLLGILSCLRFSKRSYKPLYPGIIDACDMGPVTWYVANLQEESCLKVCFSRCTCW